MMTMIEQEHQLRYESKIVTCYRCQPANEMPTHTTDHGFCSCGWEVWSRYGRDEIAGMHQAHREFVRQRQERQQQEFKKQRVSRHEIRWNDTRDYARCSWCNWSLGGVNMATILVAFDHHREDAEEHER